MRRRSLWPLVLAATAACASTSPRPRQPAPAEASKRVDRPEPAAERVEFASGSLRLHGLLWRPAGGGPFPAVLFSHGSGGATPDETAGLPMTEAAARLAPLFTRRGYAFFYPFRRGQGSSADGAPSLQQVLAREERAHGTQARQRLQDMLLQTEQLEDVLAALAVLKDMPGIDRSRLVLVGHSFGGQLTILAAAHDRTVRAAVTFGAAAESWSRSADLRSILREAAHRASCPILLVQWSNDFDTEPSIALSKELGPGGPVRVAIIYPPVGSSREEGHDGLYLAVTAWEPDVFRFLAEAVSP
ncbi:MAG: alpha/beta hydrolase family protein [Myxococcaceae bacterium]